MSDRPYHHGHLAEALVSAGLEAAARDGSGAIALRELAKGVGVSATAAYRHFPSLEHLVAAVAQRAREGLARRIAEAMEGVRVEDPRERAWARLAAGGRAYVDFAVAERRLFEVAFLPGGAPPPHPDAPSAWELLVAVIDELAALGELAPEVRPVAPLVAWATVHGLSGILPLTTLAGEDGPTDATDLVIGAVRRALQA